MPNSLRYLEASKILYHMSVNVRGEYIYGNDYFLDRFDCRGLEDGTLKVEDTILIDDLPSVSNALERALKEPDIHHPIVIRKPVGNTLVHTEWEFVCYNESPDVIHCIGYDISEMVMQTHKSNVITSRVEHIINSFSSGFYFLSKDWKFIMVNDVFLKTVDLTKKDLLGKSLWEIFPDDDGYEYPNSYRKAMETGVPQKFEDYRPDLKKWFGASAYPSDEGLAIFFKDITKEKEAREQLIDSRNKLLAIFESSSEANILIDKEFNILWFNRTAAEGARAFLKKEMAIGKSMLEFTLPETYDIFISNFKAALKGEISDSEHLLHFLNGNKRWFNIKLSPAFNENDELIGAVFNSKDIDDIKNYEIKLEEQNKKLTEIAHHQSHEMRAPLARLLGLIELMKKEPQNDRVLNHLDTVGKELDSLMHDIMRKTE